VNQADAALRKDMIGPSATVEKNYTRIALYLKLYSQLHTAAAISSSAVKIMSNQLQPQT
jgi:hypothetical protein